MSVPKQSAAVGGPSAASPNNTSPRAQEMNPSAKGAIPQHVKIANGRSNSPARTGTGGPISPTPGPTSAINWDAINRDPRVNGARIGQTSPETPKNEPGDAPSSPVRNMATPPPKQPPPFPPPPGSAAIGKTTPIKRAESDTRPTSMPPVTTPEIKPKTPTPTPPPSTPSPKIVFRDDKIKAKPAGLAPVASPPPASAPNKPVPTFGMQTIVGQIPPPQSALTRSHTASGLTTSAGASSSYSTRSALHASHDGVSRRKTVQIVDPGLKVMATHYYQQKLVAAKAAADAEVTAFANEMRSFQEFSRSDVLRTLAQFATKFVALNVKDITGADCRKYVTDIMSLLKSSKRASSRLSSPTLAPAGGRTLTPAEERAVSKMLLIISQFSRIASAADEQENDASIVDYLSQQAALTGAVPQYESATDQPTTVPKQKAPTVICRVCERQVAKNELESHTESCRIINTSEPKLRYINDTLSQKLNALQSSFMATIASQAGHGVQAIDPHSQINLMPSSPSAPTRDASQYKSKQTLLNMWFMDNDMTDDRAYSRLIRCNCMDKVGDIVQKIFAAPIHKKGGLATGSMIHMNQYGMYVPRIGIFLDDSLPLGSYELNEKEEVHFKKKPFKVDASRRKSLMGPLGATPGVGVAHTGISNMQFIDAMSKLLKDAVGVTPRDKAPEEEIKRIMRYYMQLRTQNALFKSKYASLDNELRDLLKRKSDILAELSSVRRERRKSLFDRPVAASKVSLSDFEIVKPISKGAYGEVFLAKRKATGDVYAVKALKKQEVVSKNQANRIAVERNILAFAQNPFVVKLYFTFQSKNYLFMVMEYLPGGDVFSLLRNLNCFSEEMARHYIAELVVALEYLHAQGVVHRDLKPDNMLITRTGHIKLTDFGLSAMGLLEKQEEFKIFLSPTEDADEEGKAVGSPEYLAPEVMLGTGSNHMVDWWAVGVMLYEFLVGITPFYSDNCEDIFQNILAAEINWPEPPDPELSDNAKDLIQRLLMVNPTMRLGANGAAEVKSHPFFAGVDWGNMLAKPGPYVPKFDNDDQFNTEYFEARNEIWDTSDCSIDVEAETEDDDEASASRRMRGYSFVNFAHLANANKELTGVLPYQPRDLEDLCRVLLANPTNEQKAAEYRQTRNPTALRFLVDAVVKVAHGRARPEDISATMDRVIRSG